jgi:hypothetical protein
VLALLTGMDHSAHDLLVLLRQRGQRALRVAETVKADSCWLMSLMEGHIHLPGKTRHVAQSH